MTKIYLKYNPYIVESEIAINGEVVQAPNKLFDLKNERIQVWIENLIPMLDEICNDNEYEIDFYGTCLDYDDMHAVIQDYCERNPDVDVKINFTEAKGSEGRLSDLIELFDDMQKNCPFEDLKTDQIKENFQIAISSEFEVSVIATMSSGKSTLINSLLGKELMPSKNEACTATIAKIKDVDGMVGFKAEYRDKQNNVLGVYDDLCLQNMNEMNDNPNTAFIDIEGDIPNIGSSAVQLVLIDTPGPNNSRTEEHKNHTYRVIKEKTKPMVLYVLNATQLQTNDDRELLTAVSEAMRVGGKQSKDRFLFAVNKIDLFDPDKESVQGALDNVREYLSKFDIENPNIFPISAEMAKVIRMNKNGYDLTKGQSRTLRDYDLFIEEEQLHLSQQASLSRDNLKKVEDALIDAGGDKYEQALIHTGILAIELAIDEYLRKYAYTTKVKAAVDTFKRKVEEKDMRAKMLTSIKDNEEARRQINAQLNAVKVQLEEGKSGVNFRKKIKNLDMMQEADTRIQQLRTKINSIASNKEGKKEMTTLEVQQMMMKLDRRIRELQSDVKTELESIIEDVIIQSGQVIMNDYRQHMHELISSGDLSSDEYSGSSNINFLEGDIPNAQDIINQYKYNDSVDTGEVETIKNEDKHWWNPFTWFDPSYISKKVYKEVEMVRVDEVYSDFIDPVIAGFFANLDNARKAAKNESDRFVKYFLKELDKLDDILKKKVEENEKLTRNHGSIEQKLKEDKVKMEWLDNFIRRLDEILYI